ncbi:hypothetical protein PHLCEN_2v10675 [Hermanssonia centrifuga]|uniref:Uncharacterized protein n=1 Tax=Hermanssonia centrifuga TaxID=98765 RepID=A0A2R6NLW6_9APHY|nr:hypothetical protein PHLCEN_2v10675 [Hermanssonia centrifuga]
MNCLVVTFNDTPEYLRFDSKQPSIPRVFIKSLGLLSYLAPIQIAILDTITRETPTTYKLPSDTGYNNRLRKIHTSKTAIL